MRRSQQVIAAIVLAACVLMVLHHLLSESGPSAPSNRPPSAADLLYYQDMPLRHHSAAAVLDAEDRRTVEAFQKLVVGAEQRKKLTHGSVIMGKMGNDTIRAELGRATWRLLHTMAVGVGLWDVCTAYSLMQRVLSSLGFHQIHHRSNKCRSRRSFCCCHDFTHVYAGRMRSGKSASHSRTHHNRATAPPSSKRYW